uniref:Uncharacterized protein n=1 Tax=Junco hyemalis TaxID=40217 RepID=A0A8C5IDI5_JUNHY
MSYARDPINQEWIRPCKAPDVHRCEGPCRSTGSGMNPAAPAGLSLGIPLGTGLGFGIPLGTGLSLGITVGTGMSLGITVGTGMSLGITLGTGLWDHTGLSYAVYKGPSPVFGKGTGQMHPCDGSWGLHILAGEGSVCFDPRVVWVEMDPKATQYTPAMAGTLPTIPGCSKPCPTWPWALPGIQGLPQLLWAPCASACQPSE